LRRPLLWAVAALGLALWLAFVEARDARATEREFDDGLRVTARPDADWDGGRELSLTYVHPSGQVVKADTTVQQAGAVPTPGEPVEVVVSTVDPTSVRVVGDRPEPSRPALYLLLAAPPLLLWAMRRWSWHRSLQLVEGDTTAYQMRAVASSPGWWSWRWRLHLFALDAGSDSLPVCTVPLIARPAALGERMAEVKGTPRPWGRVVAREQADQEVLWPSGRGLRAHGWRRSSLQPGRAIAPSPSSRWLIAGGLAVFVVGMAVDVFVDEALDAEQRAYRVDAVVDAQIAEIDGPVTRVQYEWLGETIHAEVVTSEVLGPRAPIEIWIDPVHPTRAWAPGEDPPGTSIVGVFYLVGLALLLTGVVQRLVLRRQARRPLPPPPTPPPLWRRPPPLPEPPATS
jgi:hypothetical protein